MNNNKSLDEGQKLLGLEVIRFLAAMAVLLFHYRHFSFVGQDMLDFRVEEEPLYRLLKPFYDYGRYGVQVFWGISGYIFFWKYRDRIAQNRIGAGDFFVLRFSRLYPLHFVTLLLVAALQYAFFHVHGSYFVYSGNDVWTFFLHLFMASDWGFWQSEGFNGPVWSISVEVLVYFIFFAMLRALGSSMIWNALIIVGCTTAVLFKIQYMVIQCALFFYMGGIVASAQPRLSAYRRSVTIACVALLLGLAAAGLLLGPRLTNVKPTQVILIAMPAVLLLLNWYFHAPRRFHGVIQAAGNMTYSSYLLHFPIQLTIALVCAYFGLAIPYRNLGFFLFFMGTTLVLSRVVFMKFESPWQNLIRQRLPIRWVAAGASQT